MGPVSPEVTAALTLVAGVLREIAEWGPTSRDEFLSIAEQVDRSDVANGWCCPLCQEVDCWTDGCVLGMAIRGAAEMAAARERRWDSAWWCERGWDVANEEPSLRHPSEAVAAVFNAPANRPAVDELAWFRVGFVAQRRGEPRIFKGGGCPAEAGRD